MHEGQEHRAMLANVILSNIYSDLHKSEPLQHVRVYIHRDTVSNEGFRSVFNILGERRVTTSGFSKLVNTKSVSLFFQIVLPWI